MLLHNNNCFALKLTCRKCGRIGHICYICQSKSKVPNDQVKVVKKVDHQDAISYAEFASNHFPTANQVQETDTDQARCLNDIFMLDSMIRDDDEDRGINNVPTIELALNEHTYTYVPNTTYDKNIMSMSSLMSALDISNLKQESK